MATVTFNPGALERLLTGPDGAVAKDLIRRCIRVESQAKVNASGRPGPKVQTGRLRSSIRYVVVKEGTRLFGVVGSDVHYSGYVERGTDKSRAYPYLVPALIAAR
jgi:hypothetical protein